MKTYTTFPTWRRPRYRLDCGQSTDEIERERREARRDPDLIVSARGEWHTVQPGITEVTTADGRDWLVTSASYDEQRARIVADGGGILLLSWCSPA